MAGSRLSPDELAERENDPSPLTRFTFRHPWGAGVGSGLVVAAFCVGPAGAPWFVGTGVGLIVFLWTGLVWRPGGPGQRMRRYVLRRFPKRLTLRERPDTYR